MLGKTPEDSLRKFRLALNLKQTEFGKLVYPDSEWGSKRICDIEHGRRPMSPKIFFRIRTAFSEARWEHFFKGGYFK